VVWLQNAPRAAETDAQGHYTLTRVATGQADTLLAMAQNHADASAEVPGPHPGPEPHRADFGPAADPAEARHH